MRPDILDLIGPEYDQPSGLQAGAKTLVICAAPRTGSYELCRLLLAGGIGVPHEYFHPLYAEQIASRFDFQGNPLAPDRIGAYVDLLRARRSANNVFAAKLQYWQFKRFLRNRHGEALFNEAHIVHLFRPDVATQFRSWQVARLTGRWDFSARKTPKEVESPPADRGIAQTLSDIEFLLAEDSGFRRLFVFLGITPQFFTLDDIFKCPEAVAQRIAGALRVPVDGKRLAAAIAASAPYIRESEDWEKVSNGQTDALRQRAFRS